MKSYLSAIGNPKWILLLICLATPGCSTYHTVGPEAYAYTKAIYSICNRQDKSRLTQVAVKIDEARADSQLTATEADWLDEILATADAGDWQAATKDARQLMEAQVVGR